jgi:hypothetical protein
VKRSSADVRPGERFGRLTVTGLGAKKNGTFLWQCTCECGGQKEIAAFSLLSGRTRSCGCLVHRQSQESAVRAVFTTYRTAAKRRGHAWKLDYEFFRELIQLDCAYCDAPPGNRHRRGRFVAVYTGEDRANNRLGYIPGNVLPCCRICNVAKSTQDQGDFIRWAWRMSSGLAARLETPQ